MRTDSKIYVAGHNGMIGSSIVRLLRAQGFENLALATHSELELNDAAAVDAFFEENRPEYVVLTAGKAGGIVANDTYPADFVNANLGLQVNVIRAAHRFGAQRLLYFGSSCMYPRVCPQPMPESALLSGPMEPTSVAYATTKYFGLQMCLAYNRQYGVQKFIPVIPNSPFGVGDHFDDTGGHVLPALLQRIHRAKIAGDKSVTIWGTGSPKREFIYVDDVASACLTLLREDVSEVALPINISSGVELSIKELAEKIVDVVGFEGALDWDTSKPDGTPRKLFDSSRMKSLGWRPEIDFETGLRRTYDWYLQNIVRRDAA